MSAMGDAFKALRQVVLIHANVERLEMTVGRIGDDVDGLADALAAVRDRVSRLEGFIEGAQAMSKPRPQLPRE